MLLRSPDAVKRRPEPVAGARPPRRYPARPFFRANPPDPVTSTLQITDIPVAGYERVVRGVDPSSGLHAIIAVHDTTLGPALGGLRMWPYASEDEALFDVKRLARGMTYKSAVAKTGLGGGKAVIIGDPKKVKSEALYLAMGRLVDSLGGRYITAEDVNTSVADLEIIRRATRHVTGLERKDGGSGNPSPYTAYGVYLGVRAALGWVFGNDACKGRTVAIQGTGAVGSALAKRLIDAGAKVYGADRNTERLQQLAKDIGVVPVAESEILSMKCDVFAPCALGAILHDESIPKLQAPIVAGAANNLLLEPRHGKVLADRNVLYAPDYVINAGGIINVGVEFHPGGYDEKVALGKIERIPQALKELWTIAKEERIPPSDAADRLAERILADARGAKKDASCSVPPKGQARG
ncbi:MAG: Glu/Leu/Phe/Val dehydrogenase [Planctomycetes bacterium]|nr:Glu/Leu/Phe/Val dehydrogenase [Planctomycetota bacterium]